MLTFAERLDAAIDAQDSLLCIGLDPEPSLMPIADVAGFIRAVIDATGSLVAAYKFQLAYYEALGIAGFEALVDSVAYARKRFPEVILIGDGKRGDIGSTAAAYARAMFETWDFDAATVNVYQGFDAVEPFLGYRGRGVLVVCRTSNESSRDFQDLRLSNGSTPYRVYEAVAESAEAWNVAGDVGLVVGSTFSGDLRQLRAEHPTLPFLVPGIGYQGGKPTIAGAAVTSTGKGVVLSASRSVLYSSSDPATFAEAARTEAMSLRQAMAKAASGVLGSS